MKLMLLILCLLFTYTVSATNHGGSESDVIVIWKSGDNIEEFWMRYANSRGGLTWGQSSDYPEFSQVK